MLLSAFALSVIAFTTPNLIALMPSPCTGCTYSAGYWRTHSIYATVPALREPWPVMEDAQLCSLTYYEIVNTPPRGDPWLILARQWIIALNNAVNGASLPDEVYDALWTTEELLWTCQCDDREVFIELAQLFADYNEGRIGPGSCP